MATEWAQKKISLGSRNRGCHVITRDIVKQVPELQDFEMGMANLWSALSIPIVAAPLKVLGCVPACQHTALVIACEIQRGSKLICNCAWRVHCVRAALARKLDAIKQVMRTPRTAM